MNKKGELGGPEKVQHIKGFGFADYVSLRRVLGRVLRESSNYSAEEEIGYLDGNYPRYAAWLKGEPIPPAARPEEENIEEDQQTNDVGGLKAA